MMINTILFKILFDAIFIPILQAIDHKAEATFKPINKPVYKSSLHPVNS